MTRVDRGREGSSVGCSDHDSFSDDPFELERLRRWVDNCAWPVLDDTPDLERDEQICLQVLMRGRVAAFDEVNRVDDGTPGSANLRFSNPRFIGAGAFGIVFSTHDHSLGMEVAIKMMRPSRSESRDHRARFLGEAQSAALLSHPGIVRVYETGMIGSIPYITMTLVAGGTLADLTEKMGSDVSPRQAAWLLSEVSAAVHFAHTKAILHRDLKPRNILLAESPGHGTEEVGFQPVLSDFGLAKRMDHSPGPNDLTQEGGALGTVRYMSPEQASGALNEIGTTSDIFSLGIILYELLTGRAPFDDGNELRVRNLIVEARPDRPQRVRSSIPRDLEAVVLKCLAKEPQHRYQSAYELRLDLQRFLCDEPVVAERVTWYRRMNHTARRHPVMGIILMGALLANAVAVTGLATALIHERTATDVERMSRIREQISNESQSQSREREKSAMKELVAVYSDMADRIFAGTRIKGDEMLVSLQKSVRILEGYLAENPSDEDFLHRMSVLKHFVSMANERVGKLDESMEQRVEVLRILSRLLATQPNNELYRFQSFYSRFLLSNFLGSNSKLGGVGQSEYLESALHDIETLCIQHPKNVDYLDALAATKIKLSFLLLPSDSERGLQLLQESIELSEGIWTANQDRPLLIKYFIRGLHMKALYQLENSLVSEAYVTCSRAVAMFDRVWRPVMDERWVVEEAEPLFDVWVNVLLGNKKHGEALEVLDELQKCVDNLEADFACKVPYIGRRFGLDLMRFKVLQKTGADRSASELEAELISTLERWKDHGEQMQEFTKHQRIDNFGLWIRAQSGSDPNASILEQ